MMGSHGRDADWDDNGKKYLAQYGVTDNQVTSLNLFLQGHRIGPTGIVDVAKGLAENWSLTHIELRKQDIGKDGAVALGQALKQNRYLRYLGLGRNNLCNEGCIAVMEGLRLNQTLEFLDLEWNGIRNEGAVAIGEMLKYSNSLVSLILERNKIKASGAQAIAEALKHNEKLRNLNIGYNKIMTEGAQAFAAALEQNNTLITVSFYLNEIRAAGGAALAKALQQNRALQSINVQSNRIGESVGCWSNMLRANSTLRELNLQNCSIDADGAQELGDGFRDNQSVMSLNIARNAMGNRGMKHILSGLKGKSSLRYLDASATGLEGVEAVEDICELVELGGNLQILQMNDNNFGKSGVVLLCTRLERNVVLHSLNLDRTGMGREGALALAVALHKKAYWLSLSIAGNKIGNDGTKNVCAALRELSTLTELDLSENDITSTCEDIIYTVLQSNGNLPFIRLKGNEVARTIPSGVLTRAIAEERIAVAGALSQASQSYRIAPGSASMNLNNSLPPIQNNQSFTGAAAAGGGGGGRGATSQFAPTTNFGLHQRLNYISTTDAETTGAASPNVSAINPADQSGAALPLSRSGMSATAMTRTLNNTNGGHNATTLSHTTMVTLPRALSPSFQPAPMPYKSPSRPGLSPASFTGSLSPVKATHPPGLLRRLEGNIGGLLVTEDQLRRKFNELDVQGNGWLSKTDFKRAYRSIESFGADASDAKIEEMINKVIFSTSAAHHRSPTFARVPGTSSWAPEGRITFDEFCIIMLAVAQR